MCLYYFRTQFNQFALIFVFPARKYESGEYLNITGITRDQAGDYECSALNDIASPDTKTVKVTVNCKYISFFTSLFLHTGLFSTLKVTEAVVSDTSVRSLMVLLRTVYLQEVLKSKKVDFEVFSYFM